MAGESKIIVALNHRTYDEAYSIAQKLNDYVWGFKIGLDLIHSDSGGYSVIKGLQEWSTENIFLDSKLFDIPAVIAGTVRNIVKMRVKMFTVHCLGGIEMLKSARQAAEEEAREKNLPRPLILGVTIPTSLDYQELRKMKFNVGEYFSLYLDDLKSSEEAKAAAIAVVVNELIDSARHYLDGVICSPNEAKDVRANWPEAVIVTPGIRELNAPTDNQKRTGTAREATLSGADYLVIGRKVTQDPDPIAAIEKINAEIMEAEREKDATNQTSVSL